MSTDRSRMAPKNNLRLFPVEERQQAKSAYSRVLLKLSGEALCGDIGHGVDPVTVNRFASEIVHARQELGVELAVVVGGGNFWRGAQHPEMNQAQADYTGMLATIMNALVLQDHLEKLNQPTSVMSAIRTEQVAEPYIHRRAIRHLEKGRVVILAGGTGAPTFTTDTAASLRAAEIEAEVLLMAKNGVDGVYSEDPKYNPDAKRYDQLSHLEVINYGLKVMDSTAATHAMQNKLPIVVFDWQDFGGLRDILSNPERGTIIQ